MCKNSLHNSYLRLKNGGAFKVKFFWTLCNLVHHLQRTLHVSQKNKLKAKQNTTQHPTHTPTPHQPNKHTKINNNNNNPKQTQIKTKIQNKNKTKTKTNMLR